MCILTSGSVTAHTSVLCGRHTAQPLLDQYDCSAAMASWKLGPCRAAAAWSPPLPCWRTWLAAPASMAASAALALQRCHRALRGLLPSCAGQLRRLGRTQGVGTAPAKTWLVPQTRHRCLAPTRADSCLRDSMLDMQKVLLPASPLIARTSCIMSSEDLGAKSEDSGNAITTHDPAKLEVKAAKVSVRTHLHVPTAQ